MKSLNVITFVFLILLNVSSFSQTVKVIDVHKAAKHKGLEVFNRDLTTIKDEGHSGIRLSKALGEGVAWIKGIDFSNGILEFEVRGENVKQHSFVGIAFHGKDHNTFDAIYLRPFNFDEPDEISRSHGIQYISLPDYTWRVLRAKFPNKYECEIDPAPNPEAWVRVRVVVKDSTITTYINGSEKPTLVVEKLTSRHHGAVGFYVADTSGGDFANLKITDAP
ncbi:MAG TPA: family 16 glycoside hydrolase [Cyclobacteriaceae bacterium]|nr:family 16 glycoside hydrolase [Cyclobacteriaceae bacterium]